MWYEVARRIDPAAFTLHMLDFRGCGLSDRPAGGHDLEGYASDVRTALAAIDAPVVLAGHSMGGKVAQYVAAEGPANLEKIVLVAPGTAFHSQESARRRDAALSAYGNRARIERFQRAAMRAEVSAETMERAIEDALQAQREHWAGWYDNGRFVDFHEKLSHIAVPALCIAGEGDPLITPLRARREVAQKIPASLFVTLRDAGHNLPIEKPDEIAGALTRFAS